MTKATATHETVGKCEIDVAAKEAGLTALELAEWGVLSVMNEHRKATHNIGEARRELERIRAKYGSVATGIIGRPPVLAMAEAEGMTLDEYTELGLLTAIAMLDESVYTDVKPVDFLNGFREEIRAFIPEIGIGKTAEGSQNGTIVHPFMERLFSGDLRAIHGSDFGGVGSDSGREEHLFLAESLERIMGKASHDEIMSDLMLLESVIRHCPALENEAAAIRMLVESENVLGDFTRAVRAA